MKVDVIVVGGGLVGLATALLLSQAGFEIALIDAQEIGSIEKPTDKTSPYELRVSAMTPQAIQLFKKLGIWEDIKNFRVGYFNKIKIWEGLETTPVLFSAQGYIIENNIIQNILLSHIKNINKNKNNINILAPVEIKKIQKTAENINILLNNNVSITAKLIIGADGANSKIREWAELGLKTKNYNQSALVAVIQTQYAHENIARQRFLPNGPLAFLPLGSKMDQKNYCSIVWTTTPETAQELLNCNTEDFNNILENNWGKTELGELKLVGSRAVFSLSKKHAKNYVSDRVVLVGDAAHVIHPLAGQGVNLGFLDAQKLVEILSVLKKQNRDIGLFNNLRKYELARKGDNSFMQNIMELFNQPNIRKLGINLVRNNNFLKKLMVYWTENREKIL